MCHKKIPVARLNALPFSTTCVACQREVEMYGGARRRLADGSWEKINDSPLDDKEEINIAEIEMDLSK
jgi:DnaK suppressor protein